MSTLFGMYDLTQPRFENMGVTAFAGLRATFSPASRGEIPQLWARFVPTIPTLPGRVGRATYGLCFPMVGSSFDYMPAIAVADPASIPGTFAVLTVPAHRYAVFAHDGHVSQLHRTIDAIWREWLPGSGQKAADDGREAPGLFERYGEGFDAAAGRGDVEVWLPLAD